MPALESAYRLTITDRPKAIRGIVNGTCNFVCDQLATGRSFESAVKLAQKKGFAEADPTLDLDGTDAAQKLVLLIRAAFGIDLSLGSISRKGIERLNTSAVLHAASSGNAVRLVAECEKTLNGIDARVRLAEFPADHPFARTKGADNCLLIETERGEEILLRGRGAGRYATSESVIADLFDIRTAILKKEAKIEPTVSPSIPVFREVAA